MDTQSQFDDAKTFSSEGQSEPSAKKTKTDDGDNKSDQGDQDEGENEEGESSDSSILAERGSTEEEEASKLKKTKIEDGIAMGEWKRDERSNRRLVYGSFDANLKFLRRACLFCLNGKSIKETKPTRKNHIGVPASSWRMSRS